MEQSADKHPHALVVPASGQGHGNACMLLARKLAAIGFQVSFVYFSSQYAQLQTLQHPDSAHTDGGADTSHASAGANTASGDEENVGGLLHIHVVEDGGFTPGGIPQIFSATPAMKENLFNLILELQEQGAPITCIIIDPFAPWAFHVAERTCILPITYWTASALSFLLLDLTPLFLQGIFPDKGSPTQWKSESPLLLDHIPGLPPFSSELYPKEMRFADASSPFITFFSEASQCGKRGERVLIQTMSQLEPDAFHALQVAGISAYGIGPLLHHPKKQEGPSASSQAMENLHQLGVSQPKGEIDCISWLNTQAESSVIYIAFGSIASITVEEIQELAFGLEASGNPFLWAIRKDLCSGAELAQVLPNGLLDRIRSKGMVVSWAPQVEVLAHKAVGGFLTHCGWNSTQESLWEGVPMLCCPRFAEQSLNSHYLCDVWGVGLELGRTYTGGIERGYVEVGVKALMQEEVGVRARGKAQEVMQLARKASKPGGQSFSNLQKFYEDMKELCCQPSLN